MPKKKKPQGGLKEYLVREFTKLPELEAFINEKSLEGWILSSCFCVSHTRRMFVVAMSREVGV